MTTTELHKSLKINLFLKFFGFLFLTSSTAVDIDCVALLNSTQTLQTLKFPQHYYYTEHLFGLQPITAHTADVIQFSPCSL